MRPHWGVLIVSACPDDHEQLRMILEHCGWSVESAFSPDDTQLRLGSRTVSVVLTDFDFPDGRCWKDVLDSVARLPEPPPVLVMSPVADAGLWSEALTLGAYDILLKPLDATEVRCALDFARPVETAPIKLMKGVVMVLEAPEVQALVATVLRRDGYHVLTPAGATAARLLELVDVAVVITNQPETVSQARPDARILYTAAVPDRELARRLPNPAIGILEKPFRAEQLLAEVARLLRKPAGTEASVRQRYRPERLALRLPRRYLVATSIESGPARCSTRADRKPTFRAQPVQSAPV